MKGLKFIKLLTIISSIVLLVSLFGTAGTVVMAEDGEEDGETIYYDADGEELEDPYNADECYDSNGDPVPCPTQSEEEDDGDDDSGVIQHIPPGQLVRNAVSGPIVGIGEGYVLIETNFGPVKVYTDEEVDESMIGQRVAIKLNKSSDDGTDDGDETGDGEYYRIATAVQFRLIPDKGTRKHSWGTVESTDEGCFFVNEDGVEIPIECGDSDEDMVGLVEGDDDEDGEDDGDEGSPVLLGTQQTSRIQERIQRRLDQAEEEGDEKTLLRLQQQLERYEEKQEERQERKTEREAVRAEKAKGKPEKDEKDNNSRGNAKDK